jgi:hypothetical protein
MQVSRFFIQQAKSAMLKDAIRRFKPSKMEPDHMAWTAREQPPDTKIRKNSLLNHPDNVYMASFACPGFNLMLRCLQT